MIKLEIKEYCNQCTDFEADVIKTMFYSSSAYSFPGQEETSLTEFIIRCKHCEKCERIKKYLLQRGKGE